MKLSLALLSVIAAAQAAYVPSDPWSTLTPSKSATVGITDHTAKFGISIQTLASTPKTKTNANAPASTTKAAAQTAGKKAKRGVINQIGDGQIQHQTNKPQPKPKPRPTVASVVNQIGDGQIQNQTKKPKPQPKPRPTVASVVNQIGDGQIQNQTKKPKPKPTPASVVNQIGDGQIQNQTKKPKPSTATGVKQIGDGQIQHQTPGAAGAGASKAKDGQVQATGVPTNDEITEGFPIACLTSDSLSMILKNGVLIDSLGRIGAIVANYQFQFDGPPQAGTIYAGGWSITPKGLLALGGEDLFYQCKSGDFYNLYFFEKASDINPQCEPVLLNIIDFVKC